MQRAGLTTALALMTLLGAAGHARAHAPSQPELWVPPHDFVTDRSRHFELVTDLDDHTRIRVLERLEAFHSAIAVMVPAASGVTTNNDPIRVLLFGSPRAYSRFASRHAPARSGNGGYYDGLSRTVVSYWRSNPLQVIFHETAHAVLGDLFEDPQHRRYHRPDWPVWFDEGFAEYASSYEREGRQTRFGAVHPARLATLVDAVDSGRMLPLARVLRAPAANFSGRSMNIWYAHAWGLTHLLLSDPDLRTRVPFWIHRLRRREDGFAAFREVFGADLDALQRRLVAHVRELADRPVDPRSLYDATPGGAGLDGWTQYEGGHWRVENGAIEGQGSGGWDYLTRAIEPTRELHMELRVRRDAGTIGVVLGYHALEGYPYHTLVDLSGSALTVRRTRAAHRIEPVGQRPSELPAGVWVPVRLRVEHGMLSAWVDGAHVLTVPVHRPLVSLVGVYLHGGSAGFRELRVRTSGSRHAAAAATAEPKALP